MGLLEPLPGYLLPYVYEVVNGKPIFRKGYKEALLSYKSNDVGSSSLQSFIVTEIIGLLFASGIRDRYVFTSSEHGIHLGKNDNRSMDIAIFDKADFKPTKKYADKPPLIVLEVDIDADIESWTETKQQYYQNKTKDLLNFGVQKVIWVFTETKSVVVATAQTPWQIFDGKDEVHVIDNCTFNLSKIIDLETL